MPRKPQTPFFDFNNIPGSTYDLEVFDHIGFLEDEIAATMPGADALTSDPIRTIAWQRRPHVRDLARPNSFKGVFLNTSVTVLDDPYKLLVTATREQGSHVRYDNTLDRNLAGVPVMANNAKNRELTQNVIGISIKADMYSRGQTIAKQVLIREFFIPPFSHIVDRSGKVKPHDELATERPIRRVIDATAAVNAADRSARVYEDARNLRGVVGHVLNHTPRSRRRET